MKTQLKRAALLTSLFLAIPGWSTVNAKVRQVEERHLKREHRIELSKSEDSDTEVTESSFESSDDNNDGAEVVAYEEKDPNVNAEVGEDKSPLEVSDHFMALSKNPEWNLKDSIKIGFRTYHPQGLVKLGDSFYFSTVEVVKKDKSLLTEIKEKVKRGQRIGIGHLYQVDSSGQKVNELTLGDTISFHPGGIDFDGKYIWVSVAEYQAGGVSIIYKVDPEKWEAEEAFRVNDHIGAVTYYPEEKHLVGLNWGSEKFYEWDLKGKLIRKVANDTAFIDYQDCKHAGNSTMICAGRRNDHLGGLDLVSMKTLKKMKSVGSVPRAPDSKKLMTRNPIAFVKDGEKIVYYFMPSDEESTIYRYEIK